MSLDIDVDSVVEVLLSDGWHKVLDYSFEIDAYEFIRGNDKNRGPDIRLGGGQENLIPASGASWEEEGGITIACPLTQVLAVKVEY